VVKELLANGADVNAKVPYGTTSLIEGIFDNYLFNLNYFSIILYSFTSWSH